jgi:hypothetical protein
MVIFFLFICQGVFFWLCMKLLAIGELGSSLYGKQCNPLRGLHCIVA